MTENITPELVTETVRLCASALRRQADEIERVAASAETPAEAWVKIGDVIVCGSTLLPLAQDVFPTVHHAAPHPEVVKDALECFGAEADPLRELLLALCPPRVVALFTTKAQSPAEA